MTAAFDPTITVAARLIDPEPEAGIGRASFLALIRRAALLRERPFAAPFQRPR